MEKDIRKLKISEYDEDGNKQTKEIVLDDELPTLDEKLDEFGKLVEKQESEVEKQKRIELEKGEALPPEYSKDKYNDLSGDFNVKEVEKQDFYKELDARLQLAAKSGRNTEQIQEMINSAIIGYYSKNGLDENEMIVPKEIADKLDMLKVVLPAREDLKKEKIVVATGLGDGKSYTAEDLELEILDDTPDNVIDIESLKGFKGKKTEESKPTGVDK